MVLSYQNPEPLSTKINIKDLRKLCISRFSQRCKTLRAGKNVKKFAPSKGFFASKWNHWEKEHGLPSIENLLKLCIVFKKSADWFLFEKGNESIIEMKDDGKTI